MSCGKSQFFPQRRCWVWMSFRRGDRPVWFHSLVEAQAFLTEEAFVATEKIHIHPPFRASTFVPGPPPPRTTGEPAP